MREGRPSMSDVEIPQVEKRRQTPEFLDLFWANFLTDMTSRTHLGPDVTARFLEPERILIATVKSLLPAMFDRMPAEKPEWIWQSQNKNIRQTRTAAGIGILEGKTH